MRQPTFTYALLVGRRRRCATIALPLVIATGVLGGASLASACGIGDGMVSPRTAAPACRAADLHADVVAGDAATGHVAAEISFTATGSTKCRLHGYPRVTMVNSRHRAIATFDQDLTPNVQGYFARTPSKHPVTISRGHQAYFVVSYADMAAGADACPAADHLDLAVPGERGTVTLRGTGAEIEPFGGAGNHRCGVLEITPVTNKRITL